ncbi:MAG TPA: carboxypeptidase-like regulatory domain-containing protein [Terracidiphilus sp.]|nr:carboxypeptidase-like regulatory domain-containing protein [Terracidiphilus sp.]
MAGCGWIKPLARTALLILWIAGSIAFAQSSVGSLSGKLTDLYSRPLEDATIVLRNRETGAESRTTTARGGSYRFHDLAPGEYSLEARSLRLGQGQVNGIEVTAGHEARVQAAIEFEPTHAVEEALREPVLTERTERGAVNAAERGALPVSILAQQEKPEAMLVAAPVALAAEPFEQLSLVGRPLVDEALMRMGESASGRIADLQPGSLAIGATLPVDTMRPGPASFSRANLAVSSGVVALSGTATAAQSGLLVAAAATAAARASLRVTAKTSMSTIEIAQSVAEGIAPANALPAAQLVALPLAGRNWQNFVLDTPQPANSDGSDHALPVGGREGAVSITVDGADTRLAFGGSRVGGMRGQSATLMGPGARETAMREVQTGSGNGEGVSAGRVNVETARGANALHGQALLFDHENLWRAQNPFTQWVKQTAPASLATVPVFTPAPYTPGDREKSWGIGMGGRVFRRQVFWFAALDGLTRNDPGLSTVKHPDNFFAQPSNDQMQVLSARLGLSSTNPVAAGVDAYSGMLQTLDGLLGPADRTTAQWSGFGRLDWAAGERHRFTVEGTGALADSPGGGLTRTSETFGTHSYASSRVDDQWVLGRWEAFVTSNLLAVTQGSIGRQYLTTPPESPSSFEQSLMANEWLRLPQIVVDSRYGFTLGNPARFGAGAFPDEHLYELKEQLDWVRGSVLVRAGVDMEHNKDETSFLRNEVGTYNYASVENFASDALAFAAFGLNGQLNPLDQHNCDQTGKVWRDTTGTLHGLGFLPCYSYYSQMMGPTNWWLSTNDWASYVTSQWQPGKRLVVSLALRWELEQAPPPLALLNNPDLPLTGKMPNLGGQWGPRASLAWGSGESRWPVVRVGYGMYFGRTSNATFETALTQTGSLKGDLNFFLRPTDNLNAAGAPPFPYVLAGEPATVVKPGAVEFAPSFRNGEVHQGVVSLEETLPGKVHVEADAIVSLGRRLPVTEDANIDPAVNPQTITYAVIDGNRAGPIKTQEITVPFFASWPSADTATGTAGRLHSNYQQVAEIFSRANSTYEAAMLRLTRAGRGGLMFRARYTYGHAMDWNPDESASVTGPSIFDPTHLSQEYGTSDLDMRHSATSAVIWEPRWKLQREAGRFVNGWMLSGIGTFRGGMPFTMRTAGSMAKEFDASGTAIVALAPGMNGYGGDNRVYGVGRNTYRYPATWKADLRLAKRFSLGAMRQLELLAESFNLFNHQNVTELETVGYSIESGSVTGGLPTLNFLTGLKSGQTEFGKPFNVNATDFYRPRQIQFGVRFRF